MGNGGFILPVNAVMRKAIKKNHGAAVIVVMEEDKTPIKLSADLMDCLNDDPDAVKYFNSLPPSHRNWYSNWIKGAKTEITKAKRIAAVITACSLKLSFREMIRKYREHKNVIQ